jgi:hypothetical protein
VRLGRKSRSAGNGRAPVPAPFVVGATRSGTTLLRLMLDAHPELAIPFETHFIPKLIAAGENGSPSADDLAEIVIGHRRWRDFHLEPDELRTAYRELDPPNAADAIRAFFGLYAEHQGKPRWGDKTPGYVKKMEKLQAVLPEARFVHIIRDGRDVALSVVPRSFGPDSVGKAARNWKRTIREAQRQAPSVDHYLEVRYEELVLDTENVLRGICEFCELDFHPAMLDYHERAGERLDEKRRRPKPGRSLEGPANLSGHALTKEPPRPDQLAKWRGEMTEYDRGAFEAVAGDLLAELGYDVAPPAGSLTATDGSD